MIGSVVVPINAAYTIPDGAADIAVTVAGWAIFGGLCCWLVWKLVKRMADGFINMIDFMTRHEK